MSKNPSELIELSKKGFSSEPEIEHYANATEIGLWDSEKMLVKKIFTNKEAPLLVIGCGAGREIIGLHQLGYKNVTAIDYVSALVARAKKILNQKKITSPVLCMDARTMAFEDNQFNYVTFFFNGLMMIPGKNNRKLALKEIHRITKPGGFVIFSAFDQDLGPYASEWRERKKKWQSGIQDDTVFEFGDIIIPPDSGHPNAKKNFMHVPTNDAVLKLIKNTGFKVVQRLWRGEFPERKEVKKISADCVLWVLKRTN